MKAVAQTTEDALERHGDLVAGLGAIAWASIAVTALPQLATIVAPEAASLFGMLALGRWYRKLRARKDAASG